jgi:post-segregation antitoxin (ccd killing protein)
MRDDYKITKATAPLQITIEKEVVETLQQMEKHTKLTVSELANTALKRFIASHKDFLPPSKG